MLIRILLTVTMPIATTLIATAMAAGGGSVAAPSSVVNSAIGEQCRLYGYRPGTRDFAECRQNVRIYWTTGPCGTPEFAAVHRRYCHIVPEIDF